MFLPGFCSFSPIGLAAEGDGAPKSANLLVSAILMGPRRAPLGAPHALALKVRSVSAFYFAVIFRYTPGRAFAVSAPLPLQRT